MTDLRLAVIGAGGFGTSHGRVFSELNGVEVTAVVDLDLSRARRLADEVGAGFACRFLEDALPQGVDAVSVVCSPSGLAEQALAVVQAGLPVLVEKPVATEYSVVRHLAEAAEAASVLAVPGYVLRFCGPHCQLYDWIRAGQRGHLLALRTLQWREVDHVNDFPGVHPILLTGVHHLDLARWFAGAGRLVSARALQRTEHGGQATIVDATAEWADGMLSTLTIVYAGDPGPEPHQRNHFEVICSDGVFPCDDPDPVTALEHALREELANFVAAVRGDEQFPVSLADAAESTLAAQAIERSAREEGRVVRREEMLDAPELTTYHTRYPTNIE